MIREITGIFRPMRWFRNCLMLLGVIVAIGVLNVSLDNVRIFINVGLAFVSICLVASGNYGINEIMDAESDRYHPDKKNRAIASGKVSPRLVLVISIILYICSFLIILPTKNFILIICIASLFLSGIIYNVRPFRFKELAYLDLIAESINNPIRLAIGWYAVARPEQIVPSSFLLACWFFGIFLMAAKRFGEIRFIDNKELAQKYRKSFKNYSEQKLMIVMVVAISASSYMLGALSLKYSVDLILFLPFMLGWIVWFFQLSYEENTIVKDPERVFEKVPFLLYSIFVFGLFVMLIFTKTQIFGFIR